MTFLYQTQQIREIESQAIAHHHWDIATLMQRAGAAAWQTLQLQWPECKTITVCCGKGNNAGDGYVLAKLAHEAGKSVQVFALTMPEELSGVAQQVALDCVSAGVSVTAYNGDKTIVADVIVDALLGIGCDSDLSDVYAKVVQQMNASAAVVLAIDVPSGLNSDTGMAYGHVVDAEITVTFLALKTGLFTGRGSAHAGKVVLETLGLSDNDFSTVTARASVLQSSIVGRALPKRRRDTHKGDFGHVLVIGGDYGMGGAVRMAAEAAMRVGAGLVTVATRPEHLNVVTGARPEIMCNQVETIDDLQPLLERSTVVVIGPGLGLSDWASSLLSYLDACEQPMVVDADALNLLAQKPRSHDRWILTPHPGEAARLLEQTTLQVQTDRFHAAQQLQQRYGGVVVLKGAGTLVQSSEPMPALCPAGNPGMASGGMGDVLSGVLGGLLAQGYSLLEAAQIGVMVHSMAADYAAKHGGERGLLATDVLQQLRPLVNPDAN